MYDGSVNDVSTRLSTTNASLNALTKQFIALTSENVDGTINTYKEVEKFLKDINDTTTLVSLLSTTKDEATESANQYTNASINNFKNNYIDLKFNTINGSINTIDGSINTLETSVAKLETQSSKYLTSINEATTTALGGIKIGYVDSEKNVAVKLEDQKAYVTITDFAIKKALGFMPAAQNEHGEAYTLAAASDTELGGIKTGYTPTGVNANKELPITLNSEGCAYVTLTENAISSAYSYTLPTATQSALGGIKTGYTNTDKNIGVNVDNEGNAYVTLTETAIKKAYTYTLPTAGTSTLGGICTGFSNTGSKVKVDMSSNNAYVEITKDAINSALGHTPLESISKATEDTLGLLKVGYKFNKNNSILNIPVKLDEKGNAYISINLEDLNCYGYWIDI